MKKLFFLFILLVFLSGCSSGKLGGRNIIVTIEPLRYFTEEICGDKFHVESLVPKGSNPEMYEPTPQQLVKLSDSRAFFSLGQVGFERVWTSKMLEQESNVHISNLSKGIDLIYSISEGHGVGHHHGNDSNDSAIGADPHIWVSILNAKIIAENILISLITIDAENESFYKSNYDKLLAKLDKLKEQVDSYMNKGSHAFLIYHPALTYFARDYGLSQIALEEEGKEPNPKYIQSVISDCKKKQVRLFFQQEEIDPRKSASVVEQLGLNVVKVNLLSYEWPELMLRLARAMAEFDQNQ